MHQRQALRVFVFQVLQTFIEHHALHALVAIHQAVATVRVRRKSAGDQRQNRCDTRACGKANSMVSMVLGGHKPSFRRHGLQALADLQLGVGPHRKHAASNSANANVNFACCKQSLWRAADRVTAPTRLTRNISSHHHVLSCLESKSLAQCLGHMQGDGFAIQAFGAQSHHLQLMKTRNGSHGEFSRA